MSAPSPLSVPPPARLERWDVEDPVFWAQTGRAVASRNLWISMPALLCGFATWSFWAVITTWMKNVGWGFAKDQYYTLTAVAGLSGATLRIPGSFLTALSGGRNVAAVTTALLLVPAVGLSFALADPGTSFTTFVVLATLSGFGGGAFASSMSNISFFFPKRMQGLALGLNAGVGNLGVSVVQFALPYAVTVGLFGALGGPSAPVAQAIRWPSLAAGAPVWVQNCGLVWIPVLLVLAVLAWVRMDNLPMHGAPTTTASVGRVLWMNLLGVLSAGVGVWLLVGLRLSVWIVLPVTIALAMAGLRWLSPRATRDRVVAQLVVLRRTHCWVMTVLYVMTFGSFIGFSFVFALLIQDVFGKLPSGAPRPGAPSPTIAFLGPLIGSLVRPVGGWLSDRFGGARVTQWSTVAMIGAAVGLGVCFQRLGGAESPLDFFAAFLVLFLLLFVTAGIGNGSTFRMIPMIFPPKEAGPVLAWTSAIAAYGSLVIPEVFKGQMKAGTPEVAVFGFAAFYGVCLVLNWWFYARKNAGIRC